MKLFEITQTKTKTKAKTATGEPDLSAFRRAFDDKLRQKQSVPATRPERARTPELKKATPAATRQRAAQVDMPPEGGEKLSFLQHLGLQDEISDEEAARRAGVTPTDDAGYVPEPEVTGTELATIENMPAVINKEISEVSPVDPEWHQVKHLPGYLQEPIRAMGRQVFNAFTETPVEDIQVVAHVGGRGPNSKRELGAVAKWLKDNAEQDTEGAMDFAASIPDYKADFTIYRSHGYTFMVVQDFAGHYIYSWPSADEKSPQGTERRAIEPERRRLR